MPFDICDLRETTATVVADKGPETVMSSKVIVHVAELLALHGTAWVLAVIVNCHLVLLANGLGHTEPGSWRAMIGSVVRRRNLVCFRQRALDLCVSCSLDGEKTLLSE